MQSFYHVTIGLRASPREKLFEVRQSLTHDNWQLGQSHRAADGAIEHPLRNLERPVELGVLQVTAAYWLTWLRHERGDRNAAIEPRMPAVTNHVGLDNVGLCLSSCTTRCAHTWRSAARLYRRSSKDVGGDDADSSHALAGSIGIVAEPAVRSNSRLATSKAASTFR
jgi:hypothetical protein